MPNENSRTGNVDISSKAPHHHQSLPVVTTSTATNSELTRRLTAVEKELSDYTLLQHAAIQNLTDVKALLNRVDALEAAMAAKPNT